jgi:hypothetical protein
MRRAAIALLLALLATSCGTDPGAVDLRPSSVTWTTYAYELSQFDTILGGSYDGETLVDREFDTWILENEYLTVTLLPDFGGRILSIVDKRTGHEQLYQNPIGVPYQIGTGVFYYDWLMVYGGIFPTFPEPEHGKAWFSPWEFGVVEESADRTTVSMTFIDDIDFPFTPGQYESDATGLSVTYFVTLERGRAAIDTTVLIENPTDASVSFEYWTNATFAPGSPPGDTTSTASAEIVAPVDLISIPGFWTEIAGVETPTADEGVYRFDRLRTFGNWPDMGIAYASPDMGDGTFWGVIDQERGEGIIRIADNTVTPGLKIWTWGFDRATTTDPTAGPQEARSYIELWAGLTGEFFEKTTLAAGGSISFDETYVPTIGMTDVTAASRSVLIAAERGDGGVVEVSVYGIEPADRPTAVVTLDGRTLFDDVLEWPEIGAARFAVPVEDGQVPTIVIRDETGATLLETALIPTEPRP